MTDRHPITPPSALVAVWASESLATQALCTKAARWGANQELKACCDILSGEFNYHHLAEPLRWSRRPKPPNLKEKALSELAAAVAAGDITPERGATIRLALEALSND